MIVRMRCSRLMLCWTVLLVWEGSVAAPDDLPREVLLLARFKQRMRQILLQVPNYTCLETIQRSAQGRRTTVFSPLDTVLMEVSTVGDKELLAWPGARRFEEADLTSFTSGGLMGSGVFALLARNVFVHDVTTIKYHGDEEIAGLPVARYDFGIPAAWSGYELRANGASAVVRLDGSFWIDPAPLELVQRRFCLARPQCLRARRHHDQVSRGRRNRGTPCGAIS